MRKTFLPLLLIATVFAPGCKRTEPPTSSTKTTPAAAITATNAEEQVIAEVEKMDGEVKRDGNAPHGALVEITFRWSACEGVRDELLEHVEGLNHLQVLNIPCSEVSDAGLKHLRGMTQLKSLSLYGDGDVTDAGLDDLKGLTQLQKLKLGYTQITDAGLPKLAGLTELQSLDLSSTRVTDAGLTHLTGLTQLHSLDLSFTHVTDQGIRHLQKALPKCEIKADH